MTDVDNPYRRKTPGERELVSWKSLLLDKPEDRLWHDSDGTWWRRDYEQEKARGCGPCLVRTDPPEKLRVVPQYIYMVVAGSLDPELIAGIYYDPIKAYGAALSFLMSEEDEADKWKWDQETGRWWEKETRQWIMVERKLVNDGLRG